MKSKNRYNHLTRQLIDTTVIQPELLPIFAGRCIVTSDRGTIASSRTSLSSRSIGKSLDRICFNLSLTSCQESWLKAIKSFNVLLVKTCLATFAMSGPSNRCQTTDRSSTCFPMATPGRGSGFSNDQKVNKTELEEDIKYRP